MQGYTDGLVRPRQQSIQQFNRLCSTNLPSISDDLLDIADTQLFRKILANSNHVLYGLGLLPHVSCATKYYNLLTRAHNRQLPAHKTHLIDCNFINRVMYSNIHLREISL